MSDELSFSLSAIILTQFTLMMLGPQSQSLFYPFDTEVTWFYLENYLPFAE